MVEGTRVSAEQIDEDLALLSHVTNCIRTYSVDDGRDDVLKSARRHGLKVLHGIWVSNDRDKTQRQIDTDGCARQGLSRRHRPRWWSATRCCCAAKCRRPISSAISARSNPAWRCRSPTRMSGSSGCAIRDVQSAVDFVTMHILPYWEDFPIPASAAAAHVEDIRKQVARRFPEQGDPDRRIRLAERRADARGRAAVAIEPGAGHCRDVGAGAARAFPRQRHRGVRPAVEARARRRQSAAIGASSTAPPGAEIRLRRRVSDHPHWLAQAVRRGHACRSGLWRRMGCGTRQKPAAATLASDCGSWPSCRQSCSAGPSRCVPIESFGIGGWLRSLAFAATAAAAPIAVRRPAPPVARGRALPRCSSRDAAPLDGLGIGAGRDFAALTLLSVETALGLVFDPRYRDLPFAPQSAGVIAFLMLAGNRHAAARPACGGGDSRCGRAGGFGGLYRASTRPSPIGRRSGSAPALSGLRLFWCGRGTRQAEDQKPGGRVPTDRRYAARPRTPPPPTSASSTGSTAATD